MKPMLTALVAIVALALVYGAFYWMEGQSVERLMQGIPYPSAGLARGVATLSLAARDGEGGVLETCGNYRFRLPSQAVTKQLDGEGGGALTCNLVTRDFQLVRFHVQAADTALADLRSPWPTLSGMEAVYAGPLPDEPFALMREAMRAVPADAQGGALLGSRFRSALLLRTKQHLLHGDPSGGDGAMTGENGLKPPFTLLQAPQGQALQFGSPGDGLFLPIYMRPTGSDDVLVKVEFSRQGLIGKPVSQQAVNRMVASVAKG